MSCGGRMTGPPCSYPLRPMFHSCRWHTLRARIETERARMFLPALVDQGNVDLTGASLEPQDGNAASASGLRVGGQSGVLLGDSSEAGTLGGGAVRGGSQVVLNGRTGCVKVCGVELPLRRKSSHAAQR